MVYLCNMNYINPEEKKLKSGDILPLMEAFYTIQGEGFFKGSAAYFIRIGGCDVGCHWCDIKESWDSKLYPITPVPNIIDKVKKFYDIAVVTGGEPLMWNMEPLTKGLKSLNVRTHIETSGSYPVTGIWDWFCLSPKKNKLPTREAFELADELKIIIHNLDDFNFAELNSKKIKDKCKLFLQPEWSKRDKMMPLIVDYVMQNPKWRVSLQTHKYLNIP